MWFGIATSKYQFSVAPSTPFDGLLLKDPRLMHLGCRDVLVGEQEGRDVLAGGVIGLAAILRVRVRVRVRDLLPPLLRRGRQCESQS